MLLLDKDVMNVLVGKPVYNGSTDCSMLLCIKSQGLWLRNRLELRINL